MGKITALIIFSFLLAGCMTVNSSMGEKEINPEMIAKIKIGESKKAEILEWFGNPHSISPTAKGQEVYKFVYMNTKSKVSMIPFSPTDVQTRYEELNVTFDKDIVVDYSSTRR